MKLIFKNSTHSYTSEDNTSWKSVTTITGNFKQPFDSDAIALKSSKNKKGKWYGMSVSDIQKAWKKESDRSLELGNWYHNLKEKEILGLDFVVMEDSILDIVPPKYEEDIKIAPDQVITNGVYPEHMVYLKSAGICGQSDLVTVCNNKINITDYKTGKEIKKESFKSWDGISQKMLQPLNHLDDCNYNHYALQLSIYMYIMLKHNPSLSPGEMLIHHILFEESDKRDEFDYPIYLLNENGDPIVKEVVVYSVPYLKDEVMSLIKWLDKNPIKKK